MQKSVFIKLAAVAVAAVLSQSAFAGDGNVNFNGEVVDAPCSIAPSSQNLTVPLGKVSRTVLDGTVGKKSTPAKFSIELLGCPAASNGASVTFTGPADTAGNLRIDAGMAAGTFAQGVAIELGDSGAQKIAMNTESKVYVLAQGDNALKFQAGYISTAAAVTVGRGDATALFTINYK
jgi:major type 1 subunit fimbrin (pilin)